MTSERDGHVRVLPIHVANKIAAGEVVERPASVVKELVENAIDAGARRIAVSVVQGGRKLVAVQDDGCGMTKDDALLSLERQATSKIRDVDDIERIDTLGFRGEAIPSIASVSRFTLTTRRANSDEGTVLQVNAGVLAEVRAVGCPPGTLVEVRDLFCNVPARRKFLRACATEENHIRQIFTVHALAHPAIGFSLSADGRELYRLAPANGLADRVRELFGDEFVENCVTVEARADSPIAVRGYVERPNLSTPTRRDQYVFVNGRPATAPAIAYALREACPRRAGDTRPAVVLFINLPPDQVDVNVHPTKREVRFRNHLAVRNAVIDAVGAALAAPAAPTAPASPEPPAPATPPTTVAPAPVAPATVAPPPSAAPVDTTIPPAPSVPAFTPASPVPSASPVPPVPPTPTIPPVPPTPAPVETRFVLSDDGIGSKPWQWFRFLAQTSSGYLLIETDSGIVTINPHAARERIVYERLLDATRSGATAGVSQALLIPETVRLSPVDAARIEAALPQIAAMGFQVERFGRDTFKIDAVPQLIGSLPAGALLASIAGDLSEGGARRGGERWKEELIAKTVARSFAGASQALTEDGAVRLVEELCACRMPYVCPRGKPVMIFTSTRELARKFSVR
ncbi:MAG: DNA mismatch repair endonuclease MutL [Kiritimatiellia bacterium]